MKLPDPRGRRHIVLVGMMGAGKTSTGRRLAALLRRKFVDTDTLIESEAQLSIGELFQREGEERLREIERRVFDEALSSSEPSVIATGGGAVLDDENRERVAEEGEVVWLRAKTATLAGRVEDLPERPLLGKDARAALDTLEPQRRPLYEQVARSVIDVDELDPEATVMAVIRAIQRRVDVVTSQRMYPVIIGAGARHLLSEHVPPDARKAAIVTQAALNVTVVPGIDEAEFVIGLGEQAKSLSTIDELCRGFARAGLHRGDLVVGLGGGVVTDVAGFAAACFHRGLPVVHVATTLLAQIDAAIGGKTGVNLPEGKNLVGAYWQPYAVFCDTDLLATLPDAEWRSGLGEMAKYLLLGLDHLEDLALADQVAACVRMKAEFVAADERDGDKRRLLNYGHTLAHALEAERFGDREPIRHGEAVAIGLVFSARLARVLGRVDDDVVKRHVAVVEEFGLPSSLPADANPDRLVEFMARDKKANGGLTFVLFGPSGVEVVHDVPEGAVKQALAETQAPAPAAAEGARS
ncbi:MAG: bifunctional shikimate kinase/3-dehydroquinate synthase [Acidimicrobiales bacterium]